RPRRTAPPRRAQRGGCMADGARRGRLQRALGDLADEAVSDLSGLRRPTDVTPVARARRRPGVLVRRRELQRERRLGTVTGGPDSVAVKRVEEVARGGLRSLC